MLQLPQRIGVCQLFMDVPKLWGNHSAYSQRCNEIKDVQVNNIKASRHSSFITIQSTLKPPLLLNPAQTKHLPLFPTPTHAITIPLSSMLMHSQTHPSQQYKPKTTAKSTIYSHYHRHSTGQGHVLPLLTNYRTPRHCINCPLNRSRNIPT